MRFRIKQSGLSLIEQLTVLATVSLLVAFSMPAVEALVNSFETTGGAEMMISSALATGRAIAAKQQRYAGVRFQCRYDATKSDKLGCQYMIFIVHDMEATGLANGFRAVEGTQPIKLPQKVGVMDLRYRTNSDPRYSGDNAINDVIIDTHEGLRDTTTFSIIFSPSGKLLIHDVRVRNRDGERNTSTNSEDDVFNTEVNVEDKVNGYGEFIQDDYASLGLGQEFSRGKFVIYDRQVFGSTDANRRYTDYLEDLKVICVNPYTGRMIE
jgi:hypothetical protein